MNTIGSKEMPSGDESHSSLENSLYDDETLNSSGRNQSPSYAIDADDIEARVEEKARDELAATVILDLADTRPAIEGKLDQKYSESSALATAKVDYSNKQEKKKKKVSKPPDQGGPPGKPASEPSVSLRQLVYSFIAFY